jgi:hypothetical protein
VSPFVTVRARIPVMSAISTTPVVGLPQQGGWSQVFQPDHAPALFVFAVSGDNAGNVGRDLVDILEEVEPQNAAELHQVVELMVREATNKDCQLSVASLLLKDQRASVAAIQGTVVLKRAEKVGKLLAAGDVVSVVEGSWHPEDVFVLSTQQGLVLLGEIQQKLIQGYEVDTIITSIVPGVHALPDSSQTAIAFVAAGQPQLSPVEPLDDAELLPPESVELPVEPDEAVSSFDLPSETVPVVVAPTKVSPLRKIPIKKIFNVSKSVGAKVVSAAGAGWGVLSRRLRRKDEVYVGEFQSRKFPKWLIGVGIILVVIAAIAGWQWQKQQRVMAAVAAQLQPLQAQLATARTTAATDPIAAREQLESLATDLETLQQTYQKQPAAVQPITKTREEVRQFYDEISGRDEFQSLPSFYDLRNAQADFIATSVAVYGQTAYFVDSEQKKMVILNLDSKQQRVIDWPDSGQIKDVSVNAGQIYILGDGIWKRDDDLTNQPSVARAAEESINEARLLTTFAGNVYLWRPAARSLVRLPADDEGKLDEPQNWLRAAVAIDADGVRSMVIDGDVWLGDRAGQIARLRAGRQQEFSLRGVPGELTSLTDLYTVEEDPNLYVLDAAHNRVLVIAKDGTFLREVVSSSLGTATQIFVAEEGSQIYLLSGSIIYAVDK